MILEVTSIEEKRTQKGKAYNKINGKYYDWGMLITANRTYDVQIDDADPKFPKIIAATISTAPKATPKAAQAPAYPATDSRDKMMMLSYAKDLTLALLKDKETNQKQMAQTLAYFYTILPLIINNDIKLGKKIKDIHDLTSKTDELLGVLEEEAKVVEVAKKVFDGEEVKSDPTPKPEPEPTEDIPENNF